MSDLDQKLAQRVRDVRESLGLSQGELAKRMQDRGHKGFQQQTIARIETGNRKITYGEAVDLAASMNHTIDGLLGAPGEDALVAKGALVGEARNALTTAANNYAYSLLEFTHTADGVESSLRDNQKRYLDEVFSRQTPAMLTLDSGTALRATLSRWNLSSPGEYVERLLASVDRDAAALKESSPGWQDG